MEMIKYEINIRIEYMKSKDQVAFGSMEVLSWLVFLFGVINLINTTLSNQIDVYNRQI